MRGGWVERGTVLIRLTRPHFAFYRGYLEGLDIGPLAHRYLETTAESADATSDLRIANSSVKWIRDQLLVAARRATGPTSLTPDRAAQKLRVQYGAEVPTLEQYREERDPYEMYGEADLIAFFEEEYGSGSKRAERQAARNARLRARQMAAMWQLEELVAADPKLTDGVDGWLDPAIAVRLKNAQISTLQQLVDAINGYGYRWYTKVPRVGEKAAAQIVKWLIEPGVSAALGIRLQARGLQRKRDLPANLPAQYAPRTDIVPLENLFIPKELDGANGSNRGDRSLLSAHNDLAAVQAWLNNCRPGSHTLRSYRKEAERFILWSLVEKRKPLSSLTVEDCIDYRDFLWNLGRVTPEVWARKFNVEQARWLGTRGTPRWSQFWRPFEGPLAPGSQKLALVVIQSLCQWLTDQHYLHGNPFQSVGKLAKRADRIDVSRALTIAEWTLIKTHLSEMTPDPRYWRLRLILLLAYSSGARLSELAAMRRSHLRSFEREDASDRQWTMQVKGKGDVARELHMPLFVMNELRHYFRQRGHTSLEDAPGHAPLIAGLEMKDSELTADVPLSAARLYDVIKGFFAEVADALPASKHESAERIRRASTHWLRHTFATHFLQSGGELAILRDLLGHKSLATTSVYVTTERDNRSRAMERFGNLAVL
jgi:site-specific recombinase XerD